MTNSERAKEVYSALCGFLDREGFKYTAVAEKNLIKLTVSGEDFPVTLYFAASKENQRVEIYSQLSFEIKSNAVVDLAMAMSFINSKLFGAKFSMDYPGNKYITYDDTVFFTGLSGFSNEYAKNIVSTAFTNIEKYNDQLYAVNKSLMSVRDFTIKNQ